jgi:hypothetical protein
MENALSRAELFGRYALAVANWHRATWIAPGMLHGTLGHASHVKGNTWRFEYVTRSPLGMVRRVVECHSSAITVESSNGAA